MRTDEVTHQVVVGFYLTTVSFGSLYLFLSGLLSCILPVDCFTTSPSWMFSYCSWHRVLLSRGRVLLQLFLLSATSTFRGCIRILLVLLRKSRTRLIVFLSIPVTMRRVSEITMANMPNPIYPPNVAADG
jgi:hypothetical protein